MTDLSTYWKDYDPETGVGDPSTPLAAQTLNEWGADVEQIRADAENFRNQAQEAAEQAEAPTDAMVASVVANPSSDAHAAVAGVIDAKSPTVSVVTFGAVGDGVADDTAAIQSAIDANPGRALFFPVGTYVVTSLKVPHSIAFTGAPGSIVKHKAGAAPVTKTHSAAMFQVTAHNITVRFDGLTLDGNYRQQGAANGGNATAATNTFVSGGGITYGRLISAYGLTPAASTDQLIVSVENCTLRGIQASGIAIDAVMDTAATEILHVRGCTFHDFAPGVAKYDPTLGIGYAEAPFGVDPSAIVVTGAAHAIVDGCTFRGLRDPYTSPTPGFSTNVYNLPSNAIRVTIDDPAVSDPTPEWGTLSVTGCDFDGMGRHLDAQNNIGVVDCYSRAKNVRVVSNNFTRSYHTPIRAKSNIDRCVISGNTIETVRSGGGIIIDSLVHPSQGGQYRITDNVISDVDLHGIMVAGETGGLAQDVLVSGNSVITGGQRGIYLRRVYGGRVKDNYIRHMAAEGIYCDELTGPMNVSDNEVIESGGHAIDLRGAAAQSGDRYHVSGNQVNVAVDYGIVIRNVYTVEVIGNTVTNISGASRGYFVFGVAVSARVIGNDAARLVTTPLHDPSVANVPALYVAGNSWEPNERFGTAAPTTGAAKRGDRVWNSAPTASGVIGWVCTAAGTPGTWKPFGAISA